MKRISLLYIVSFFVFFGCGGLEQVVTETKKQLPDSPSPVREGDVQTHAVTDGNSGTAGESSSGQKSTTPQAAFAAMFPDAWDVEWENERGLLKVEFRQGYHEKEAWFRTDGTWVRTVTDLKLSEVPSAVLSSVKTRTGSGWKIEDIDLVEQAESPAVYYLAECEKVGSEQQIHLRIAPDGTIL